MSGVPVSPSSYLKYLPALYRSPLEPGAEPPFIAVYLKIFEKLLSGITESAPKKGSPPSPSYLTRKGIRELLDPEVIGTLFHPRLNFLFSDDPSVAETFTPPLSKGGTSQGGDNLDKLMLLAAYVGAEDAPEVKQWLSGFLNWIAGTVALDMEQGWGIDTKRFVIAQALPLFRARGTIDGMTWLLNAWFGLDRDAPVSLVPKGAVRVVKISVTNPSFAPIRVCDSEQAGAFVLEDDIDARLPRLSDIVCFEEDPQTQTDQALGYKAWYFVVMIFTIVNPDAFDDGDISALHTFESAVRGVVDEFKPALTDYDIQTERINLPLKILADGVFEADTEGP